MTTVYSKLSEARIKLAKTTIKKTGQNKFAGYSYFELGDFLPQSIKIFHELGLMGVEDFHGGVASLTIVDTEKEGSEPLVIRTPMGEAKLKGCHDVQNIGAVITYQRRYLWTIAMALTESDAMDATKGRDEVEDSSRQDNSRQGNSRQSGGQGKGSSNQRSGGRQEEQAPSSRYVTAAQAKEVNKLLDETNSNVKVFKEYYGVTTTADLKQDQYDNAISALQRKQREMAAEAQGEER